MPGVINPEYGNTNTRSKIAGKAVLELGVNGNISDNVSIGAEASAFNVSGEASYIPSQGGSLGGYASISNVTISTKFNVRGWDVVIEGKGHIGAVGASGGFEYLGNRFSLQGGFASGLGGSGKITIRKNK